MRTIKYGLLAAAAPGAFLLIPATPSQAQVSIGIQFGAEPAPLCPFVVNGIGAFLDLLCNVPL